MVAIEPPPNQCAAWHERFACHLKERTKVGKRHPVGDIRYMDEIEPTGSFCELGYLAAELAQVEPEAIGAQPTDGRLPSLLQVDRKERFSCGVAVAPNLVK